MHIVLRYRWELAPLLIGASVVWLRPLLPDETTGVLALWYLGVGAVLALGIVRMSRLGRPLLTALWAVMLVRLGGPAAAYGVYALRDAVHDLGPVDIGLYLTLVSVVLAAVVVWLSWRLSASGRRHAMLVCAGYLVPGFTAGSTLSSLNPGPGIAVLALAAALALHLASLAAVAVAFGRFGELVAERQRRVVVWLLALPLAAAGLRALLLFVEFGGQDRGSPLFVGPWSLWPFGAYALTAGVLLGLTWLVTLAPLRRGRARAVA